MVSNIKSITSTGKNNTGLSPSGMKEVTATAFSMYGSVLWDYSGYCLMDS